MTLILTPKEKDDAGYVYHSDDSKMQAFAVRNKIVLDRGFYFVSFLDLSFVGPFITFEAALNAFKQHAENL